MSHPNNSRTLFLWLTGMILLLLGTTAGFGWLLNKQSELTHEMGQLQTTQQEGRLLLEQENSWEERARWIREKAPVLGEEGKTKAEVLETVLQGATDHHLQVVEQSLGELERGPASLSVSARIKVQGSLENLCHWINMWQNPEAFYAITSLSIHASDDHKTLICSMALKRFFQENK